MSEGPSSPKKLRFDFADLENYSKNGLIEKIREMKDELSSLQEKQKGSVEKDEDNREVGDKVKQMNMDASHRENTLVLRLTNKEQELQDCLSQISEMKSSQTQNSSQLRSLLLDPSVNLVFLRLTKEMDTCMEKLKEAQNEFSAWKFTADSQTGKRLMAKCRMLLHENDELGKMITSGRTSKLEAEIALQKSLVAEMKANQDEMNEFVSELEEDVEGMQSMIYVLQQQLKETKEAVSILETENERLRMHQNCIESESLTVKVETAKFCASRDRDDSQGDVGGGSTVENGGTSCLPDTKASDDVINTDLTANPFVAMVTEGDHHSEDLQDMADKSLSHTLLRVLKVEPDSQPVPGFDWSRTSSWVCNDTTGADHKLNGVETVCDDTDDSSLHSCQKMVIPAVSCLDDKTGAHKVNNSSDLLMLDVHAEVGGGLVVGVGDVHAASSLSKNVTLLEGRTH